ncbi:hypothetical protein [Paenarthrobacter nitroguajacolicus]
MNADDITKMLPPLIGALVGGGITLLATHITFKRTGKATIATERRKLSHDSAREITTQLAVATGIGRQHRKYDSLDLTKEGRDLLAECVAIMEHHTRYIDDEVLHASVDEAIEFLRPPPQFEDYLGKSVPVIIYDLQIWLGPMVQSHVRGEQMPEEPDFITHYRSAYELVDERWESFMADDELWRVEEREAKKARKEAADAAQATSYLG